MDSIVSDKGESLLDCSIKWGNNDSSTGGEMMIGDGSSHYFDETNYYPWIQSYCNHYHYPEDKTKQAFKIVKVLMKKKMVKLDKVKDFVELVDEILEIL